MAMHDVASVMSLCDPVDCSLPGSSVHGILQARILEWVAMPPPGELPNPGIEPASLMSPALAGWFFTTSTTPRKPLTILEDVKDNLTILTVLIDLFVSPCL